eukprot:326638_1
MPPPHPLDKAVMFQEMYSDSSEIKMWFVFGKFYYGNVAGQFDFTFDYLGNCYAQDSNGQKQRCEWLNAVFPRDVFFNRVVPIFELLA